MLFQVSFHIIFWFIFSAHKALMRYAEYLYEYIEGVRQVYFKARKCGSQAKKERILMRIQETKTRVSCISDCTFFLSCHLPILLLVHFSSSSCPLSILIQSSSHPLSILFPSSPSPFLIHLHPISVHACPVSVLAPTPPCPLSCRCSCYQLHPRPVLKKTLSLFMSLSLSKSLYPSRTRPIPVLIFSPGSFSLYFAFLPLKIEWHERNTKNTHTRTLCSVDQTALCLGSVPGHLPQFLETFGYFQICLYIVFLNSWRKF